MFVSELSLRHRQWQVRTPAALGEIPEGVHPVSAAIVAARGVSDLETYFTPSFRTQMPDPDIFCDMTAAVDRVAAAVRSGQRIGVIGDYDVDGATSTALLVRALNRAGHHNVTWRIPHRISDGYGPNVQLVESMIDEEHVELIIMADSGTAAIEPVARCRALGCDVVILDHHEAQGKLPDALLVNPKRPDGDRAFDYLCTAGLAFLFVAGLMRQLRRNGHFTAVDIKEPDIRELLGLVALGTVADVVPLVELNRAYVQLGLERLPMIPGISALMEVTGETKLTAHACGFVFGPCINAAGRLQSMDMGVRLLLTDDIAEAAAIAADLHKINDERRQLQLEAIEECKDILASKAIPAAIVLYREHWHPGIVGLVAAKVREAFDRPTIIIGSGGKGSARTVEGFDIGTVVINAVQAGLLVKGGGHANAAGLTIDPAQVDAFAEFVNTHMVGFTHPASLADLALECGDLSVETVLGFERMAPFGQGNTKPRVVVFGGFVSSIRIMKGLHIKAILTGANGQTEILAFNSVGTPVGEALVSAEGRFADVYGTAETSTWNGISNVIVKPEDIMVGPDVETQAA